MHDVSRVLIGLIAAAALGACSQSAAENNVTITDINNAAPGDIEQLPPDESVDTSSNELANGVDNADVDSANETAENAH